MDWISAVAERARVQSDAVADVVERYGITGPKAVPARRQLRVEAIHFAGVKNLVDPDGTDVRRFVPFSFHRDFATPVTAFVSDGINDAGKSSTLDILLWGLRGSSRVAGDVRKWLRQVCLLLTISGEQIVVAWRVDEGAPSGRVLVIPARTSLGLEEFTKTTAKVMASQSQVATEAHAPVYGLEAPVDSLIDRLLGEDAFAIGAFVGQEEMAAVMGEVMLQRLELDTRTQWTRAAGATDLDDGKMVPQGWPLWSQALAITKPSVPSAIGETPFHAQNVLNAFLATEWSATMLAARAQRKAIDGQLSGISRRRDRDREAREASVLTLRAERAQAEEELNSLPVAGMTPDEFKAAMRDMSAATAGVTQTQRAAAEAALAYGAAERELNAAEQDLVALKEAAVTKRFWHALKPSCCPRCDSRIHPEQWQREMDGSCSLCNSPIEEPEAASEAVSDDEGQDDDLDPVVLAEQRVLQLTANAQRLSALHDDTVESARLAEVEFERASGAMGTAGSGVAERRALEYRLAVLDGRIQERLKPDQVEPEEAALTTDARILEEVEALAASIGKKTFAAALTAVSAQITSLGKSLGISNLEKATLQANAHLPVVKGGDKSNFGGLTDGEKLRLKIALVVSLLDVGTTSGLGRHPGLLIVDSLAAEELNQENAKLLLRELNRVAENYGLQVITSTAHSELVAAVLPGDAIQRPTAGESMW